MAESFSSATTADGSPSRGLGSSFRDFMRACTSEPADHASPDDHGRGSGNVLSRLSMRGDKAGKVPVQMHNHRNSRSISSSKGATQDLLQKHLAEFAAPIPAIQPSLSDTPGPARPALLTRAPSRAAFTFPASESQADRHANGSDDVDVAERSRWSQRMSSSGSMRLPMLRSRRGGRRGQHDEGWPTFDVHEAPVENVGVQIAQTMHRDAQWIPQSYADLMKTNDYRERLLDDARKYSPISSVFHLRKVPQTVLWRMFAFPIVWALLAVYVVVATLTRTGHIDLGSSDDFDVGAFDGAEVLVVFMVVFYLGYCYNRYFEIYQLSSAAKSHIVNLATTGRACLPELARRKLFVHLNLMHASAYCALTPVYNRNNFMDTFCKLHHMEYPNQVEFFEDVDTAGGTHYNMCAVWAQGVLHEALQAGQCHHEVFRAMQSEILELRQCFNAIFAYQYQVIPFSYSHLVSAACFFYLLGVSFLKAARFRPDASLFGGLILPALSFWIALITTIGLIDIGQCIADPWGNDPEDFAVPRFLHSTAKMTRQLTESVPEDPLHEEGATCIGSPDLSYIPNDGQSRMRVPEQAGFRRRRVSSFAFEEQPGGVDRRRWGTKGPPRRLSSQTLQSLSESNAPRPHPASAHPLEVARCQFTNAAAAKIQQAHRKSRASIVDGPCVA